MTLLLSLLTTLLLDTASTEAYLGGQYGQSTQPLVGTQVGGFGVYAQSIYDLNEVSRVFGEASYEWEQSKERKWVENADYALLYPYLTCDTIGGGMRTERYGFRGGYRWRKAPVIWHLALQYRALQSYRSVDPRPKNKVADLQVEGSVGYTDARYAYSFVGSVGRYKQNNDISFYSEEGNATVYHLVQPNEDYVRFAGSFTSSYYHGITVSGAWLMQPVRQGVLAGVDYRYMGVTKELSSATSTPIAQLQTHTVAVQVGYAVPQGRVVLSGEYGLRLGTQYVYGDVAGNYYYLLYRSPNYREQTAAVVLTGSYRWLLPVGYLRLVADVDYLHHFLSNTTTQSAVSTQTTTPVHPYWTQLSDHLTAARTDISLSLRYAFPVTKPNVDTPSRRPIHWFFQPQFAFSCYATTRAYIWQASLHTGICF